MLMITSFDNPRVAQAFVDYMATQGVMLTVSRTEHSDIWLADASQEARVKAELAQFLREPDHPRYFAASWQTGQMDSGLRYRLYPFFAALCQKAGPVTLTLVAVCVVVYLLMWAMGERAVMIWLAWPYDPSLKVELWRYATPALLHFSLLHIVFNLLWWWYLGGALENRLGSGKLFTIMLVSALLSNCVQSLFSGAWFGGLSGVVYALMGYVWLRGERDLGCGIQIPRGLMSFALLWLIVGWFDLFGLSIANAAHSTGLAVGLVMAFTDTLYVRKRT